MAKENREHKDSVFTDLFTYDETARKNVLELYNALFDTDYTDEEMIRLVSLEKVLFMNFKNDVAFMVGDRRIVLSEHQSTINLNLPLRNLLYIAREYEKIIPVKERYKSNLLKIPTPEFIVFYNGIRDYPVEEKLRLSAAFAEKDEEPGLELVVPVININPSKQHKILEKCQILQEYSFFVETTRKYKGDKKQLEKAVRECIQKGILADYLSRKSSEVVNMLLEEYSYETDIEVQREEAAEAAAKKAREAAEKKLIEYVENISESFQISAEEACEKLKEPYEKYLEAKKKYI